MHIFLYLFGLGWAQIKKDQRRRQSKWSDLGYQPLAENTEGSASAAQGITNPELVQRPAYIFDMFLCRCMHY